ncbi:CS1 type fimbrial major subunit [Pseudomonas brassicacearum]|uniref:Adhesin n=1 Tax=Pseudomonas brassicacearum subsp. neoaurantiaca TaxID=494916 RepID=A0A7V8UA32_9PSED|nr:CS1 type fimbrial major subunit [Pseudomonas brassicacearum]MBA1376596.1 adhesin [Pseudomonas brassicacearum subsp. neoaurantiaca]
MLKQFVSATALAATALTSSLAFAAGEASSSIHIKAHIPTQQFHVQPRDPNFGKDETMSYNLVTSELTRLRATYDVKNTDGSVHAYIEGGPASLYNGNNAIPLTTTFNGVTLTATPQEVVSDAASTPGTQADLVIAAAKPAATQTGIYTADMTVIFDAVPSTIR